MEREFKWVDVSMPTVDGWTQKEYRFLLERLLQPYYDQGWRKSGEGQITEGGHICLEREKRS